MSLATNKALIITCTKGFGDALYNRIICPLSLVLCFNNELRGSWLIVLSMNWLSLQIDFAPRVIRRHCSAANATLLNLHAILTHCCVDWQWRSQEGARGPPTPKIKVGVRETLKSAIKWIHFEVSFEIGSATALFYLGNGVSLFLHHIRCYFNIGYDRRRYPLSLSYCLVAPWGPRPFCLPFHFI